MKNNNIKVMTAKAAFILSRWYSLSKFFVVGIRAPKDIELTQEKKIHPLKGSTNVRIKCKVVVLTYQLNTKM